MATGCRTIPVVSCDGPAATALVQLPMPLCQNIVLVLAALVTGGPCGITL
jgi:hypothetical protein